MPELIIAAGLARGLLELSAAKGADATDLARLAGIDPADLADQDHRVPYPACVALIRAAKAAAKDPALGLHYGETSDLAQISAVGLLASASETMRGAVVQLNRYGRLVIELTCEKVSPRALRAAMAA